MIKGIKIMLVACAATLALGLTGCSGTMQRISDSVMGEQSGSGEVVSLGAKSFASQDFDDMTIVAQAMAVELIESDSDEAKVELLADPSIKNEFAFHAEIRDRVLHVEIEENNTDESRFSFESQEGQRRLVLELPKIELGRIDVQNEFGSVEAGGLEAERLKIRLSAGYIHIDGVSAEMDLQTEAGNIEAENLVLEQDLKAVSEAGDIEIQLSRKPVSAELLLSSNLGKVTSELEDADYTSSTKSEKIGSIGTGGPRLEATTEVGTVSVR